MDITGCFHSICLSRESQLLTGSDSALPMINRYVYKRLPMGTNFSKNIQDALLNILNKINDILLYSDNIVLGALQFFSQLVPLATDSLAILHQATRGHKFNMGEKEFQAYEQIQFLLKKKPELLFVYRSDPNRKFYMVEDSSQFHTGYTLFQFCENNHPRVLRYGYRTWENRFSKLIPALR